MAVKPSPGRAEIPKKQRNFGVTAADGPAMTTAKPVAQTSQPSHTPTGAAHGPPHAPKGLAFAHILAAQPAVTAKMPKAPEMTTSQGTKLETALPQAVQGVAAEPEKRDHRRDRETDELDPSARQAAQLAPPMMVGPRQESSASPPATNARVSLEDLVPQLVKKIAWSGDAHRGTVRMELGAGELAGATLTVSAEHGRVSVRVDAPPGTDTSAWRERLSSRLEAKGLRLESVEVR